MVWSGRKIDSLVIAHCRDEDMNIEERIANARLISAAPNLLKALKPFASLLDQYEECCGAEGRIILWQEFLENYAWPSEQQCINARIALAKALPGSQPCPGCDGHDCDNGCAYPGASPAPPTEGES
jgi:hypothetical protein